MTPRAEDRDHADAINAFNARTQARGEAILRTLLAAVVGVLLAMALVHFATPCAGEALCAFGALAPQRRWRAPGWARRLGLRVQIFVLQQRLLQLLSTVQAAVLDLTSKDADVAVHLVRACDVRNRLQRVRQQLAQDERMHAAARRVARL